MGLYGSSHCQVLKKIVDESATVSKNGGTPAAVLDVMAKQTEIAGAINAAKESGKITVDQQKGLLQTLFSKMGMGGF